MQKIAYNPYDNMLAVLEQAANMLGIESAEYECYKYPECELKVSIPIRMDDGSVQVFDGYRVQHSSTRGPCKSRSSDAFKIRTRTSYPPVYYYDPPAYWAN